MPDTLTFTSVHNIPGTLASAAFTTKTSEVFKEENDIAPIFINERMKYIPWGGDNRMPYNIINLIESDETLSTCQMFNAEVCYGSESDRKSTTSHLTTTSLHTSSECARTSSTSASASV